MTFQFGPVSNCIQNLTVILRMSIMKWIYTRSLNKKLHGLVGLLKSFASLFLYIINKERFLERLQVSVACFSHLFIFFVELKDHFISAILKPSRRTYFAQKKGCMPTMLPPSSSYVLGNWLTGSRQGKSYWVLNLKMQNIVLWKFFTTKIF